MSWKAEYIILIIISTLVDYFCGLYMYQSNSKKIKKTLLYTSLSVNLGLLFFFKYFNFFSDSAREFFQIFAIQIDPMTQKFLLPVGISFYTFQTLSYTIDIYRGKIKPEKHLGIFAVYVSFFPQLVAGPIERAKNLLPQFHWERKFRYERVVNGLKLMLWGFFKKVVIADRLAVVVNNVYNNPYDHTGLSLIIATIFFAFQIYCDFSGYSDIAIGSAQVMGFNLMDNFKRPYHSRSIPEFWRRWHISLSTWFRDYVYIPLGGNRVPKYRHLLNIMIVFVVSGLWHGANWTFVIWGFLHGIYMVFSFYWQPFKKKILHKNKINPHSYFVSAFDLSVTFVLVNIGWIFFRANNISEGFYVLMNLFTGFSFNISNLNLGIGTYELFYCFLIIFFMEFIHLIQSHTGIRSFLSKKPLIIRWTIYITIILLIILFGVFNQTEFIYFQF